MTPVEEIQWASSVESEEDFNRRLDEQWEAWFTSLPIIDPEDNAQ